MNGAPSSQQKERVLLKISGEALAADEGFGINYAAAEPLAREIIEVVRLGTQLWLVVGGGNIFRGAAAAQAGMDRASADYMGMLATVMNALALQDLIEKQGTETRVMSAISMTQICEPYIRRRAMTHINAGRIVIFAAGTGNPYLTTDTAAALRAAEMNCTSLAKVTQVDGVYSADPALDPKAVRYDKISYMDVLNKRLGIMDAAAISLCRENSIPIIVFSRNGEGGIAAALNGKTRSTIICDD
jgi:uridylate kinase